jgi:hypothetical protein
MSSNYKSIDVCSSRYLEVYYNISKAGYYVDKVYHKGDMVAIYYFPKDLVDEVPSLKEVA